MRESDIEKEVCRYAKDRGMIVIKLAGPNDRGKPDRMFLFRGKTAFIEFKAPGGRPTKLQLRWMSDLAEAGFPTIITSSVREGIEFLHTSFRDLPKATEA